MLSLKQIGTVCFAIFSFVFSAPTFATGISSGASSAGCDNSTLNTYSGTSNLQANWSANEITVKWYADSEAQQPMTTNTCFYGPNSALTIPPASSMVNLKPGYTFAGWRVRQAQCGFASSVCGLNGSAVNGLTYSNSGYNSHDGQEAENASTYGLTTPGTWAVEFSNGGVIKGTASCNSTNSNTYDTIVSAMISGTMTEEQVINALWGTCNNDTFKPSNTFDATASGQDSDQYCWCKMESYTPSGESACNIASPSWVLLIDLESASNCANDCADACADGVRDFDDFRRAVFGVSQ